MINILCTIILVISLIAFISVICNLIFELYIGSLPSKKQDETLDNIKSKFNNFWK